MYRYKGRQDDNIILVDSTKRNGHLFSIKSRVLDFEINVTSFSASAHDLTIPKN